MKNFKAFETLTVEAERAEVFAMIKQYPVLKVERPQSDFKGGWIRMWTVLTPYYDRNGFNRQFSTFSIEGLREIGIVPLSIEGLTSIGIIKGDL